MRTQVGIVGAGPAGLVLAHLLHLEGIESVVLEARSREHVEHRIRAGVLEQGTVDLLREAGVADRLDREGIVHGGIHLQFDGERHRVPLAELAGDRSIVIYGQTEVVKDLIAARLESGLPLLFETPVESVDPEHGVIRSAGGELECDVIAGCDGFRGICRASVPDGVLSVYEREYPFGWLGILAAVAPSMDELVYTHHPRGFALAQRLESGIVHVNDQPVGDEPQMPFGGVKDSGWGRFGGQAVIDEFTELRWITVQSGTHPFPF